VRVEHAKRHKNALRLPSPPEVELRPTPAFLLGNLCQRTMKPSDPCAVSQPNLPKKRVAWQSKFALQTLNFKLLTLNLVTARPVPQWVRWSNFDLGIPRFYSSPTSRSPSGLRAPIQTPDTLHRSSETGPDHPSPSEGRRIEDERCQHLSTSHCSEAELRPPRPSLDDSIRMPKRFH
jgi:hypothetical protein